MAYTPVPFGEFAPDSATVGSGHLLEAYGVYPSTKGYEPVVGFTTTDASGTVAGASLGGLATTSFTGAGYFFLGTGGSLYLNTSSGVFLDLTRTVGGQYATSAPWVFARFGTSIIAVNETETVQYKADIGLAADDFVDMPYFAGAPAIGARASVVNTVGDFVFVGDFVGDEEGRTIQWSAINDPTSWTPGVGLSDVQTFPDGAAVMGITGDKTGYVLQEAAIRQFQFLPGDTTTVFEFNKLDGIPGCRTSRSWAAIADTVYYHSPNGFCEIGPRGFRRIGVGRVDDYLRANASDLGFNKNVHMVADLKTGRIIFGFTSTSGSGVILDSALIYDPALDRWGAISGGLSLHHFLPYVEHRGGSLVAAMPGVANSSNSRLGYLGSGSNLAATFTTADTEFLNGERTLVTGFRVQTDATSLTPSVITSGTLGGTETTTSGTLNTSSGNVDVLASGHYHRIKTQIAAAHTWTYAKGLLVKAQADGEL